MNNKREIPRLSQEEELDYSLQLAQYTVYKRYLPDMCRYPVAEPDPIFLTQKSSECIGMYKLNKLVCKEGEDILQKLSTVYYASMSLGSNLAVIIDVNRHDAPADIYIGLMNTDNDSLTTSCNLLENELKSNFPGTEVESQDAQSNIPELMNSIFSDDAVKNISAVSCVAALRDKSKTENKSFIQGIERFIDAMHGNPYTALFIAEPVNNNQMSEIRSGYEELYSSISSFRKSTLTYGVNESQTITESISKSVTKSMTKSISHTQSNTITKGGSIGISLTGSIGKNEGGPTKVARTGDVLSTVGTVISESSKLAAGIPPLAIALKAVGGISSAVGAGMQGGSVGQSLGAALGLNAGLHNDKSDGESDTQGSTEGESTQTGTSNSDAKTRGSSQTIQIERTNKQIEDILERIDKQLKRVQECEDYGGYSCSAYFLSSDKSVSLMAANTYRSLMIGEGSSVESSAVNSWNDETTINNMKKYLKRFSHPIFGMPYVELSDFTLQFVKMSVATVISGLELPLHLGLPTRSVYGLPVVQHAEFGRNVSYKVQKSNKCIQLGALHHMGRDEKDTKVKLDIDMFSSHTFITGSTGSGKSNTIYNLLSKLSNTEERNIKYLVVEPAKGEYKKKLNNVDVQIYGILPGREDSELLRLNPFSFPPQIHILEHLDRIVELFNICWPMYAAMPAILKDAIQRAYKKVGWDVLTSENKFGYRLFPDFSDVEHEIREILDESEYSADNKSDYIGSLVTRVSSLSTGLFGMVFQGNEITDEELFDRNVIIDLSRAGSVETKSLIMGMLVIKLQEYRMCNADMTDSVLKHITVLEEAHHLLRNSTSASPEGNDLQKKAVEMLTNAIAEMRTYGEGFVIADQAPGLLDPAVIRNTNTKIIMELPDYSDCQLVGNAVGLNDSQIKEITLLERGVAVVKQNNWLEAVLCKVDQYIPQDRVKKEPIKSTSNNSEIEKLLVDYIRNKSTFDNLVKNKDAILCSGIRTMIKCHLLNFINEGYEKNNPFYQGFIYDFLEADKAIPKVEFIHKQGSHISDIYVGIFMNLKYQLIGCSENIKQNIILMLLSEHVKRTGKELKILKTILNERNE